VKPQKLLKPKVKKKQCLLDSTLRTR